MAVVSDVISISTKDSLLSEGWLPMSEMPSRVIAEFEAAHYVRFTVNDRPGVIADLAEIFSKHRINVDAVLQEPGWSKSELPFVMTLERCLSSTLKRALSEIERLNFHVRPPLWLPVLAKGEGVS